MEQIKEEIREEDLKEQLKKLQESGNLSILEEMIKNNHIEFELNDKKYRVRLLGLKEKEELNTLRLIKFGQLIKNKDILLEKDLIKVYKEREIDILELDEKMRKLELQIHNLQLKLGESIAKNESESVLKAYETQIRQLDEEDKILYMQRTNLLQFSLENQLLCYVSEIITYLSTDMLDDNEIWKRVWDSLESFENCKDEDLITAASTKTILLQYTI